MSTIDPPIEPLLGAVWQLGPESPLAGRYVAIAARFGEGGYVTALLSERDADATFDDVPLDGDAVRWLDSAREHPKLATIVGARGLAVARHDLALRVATLRREFCDNLRSIARGTIYGPTGHGSRADADPIEPSEQLLIDLADINMMYDRFEELQSGPVPLSSDVAIRAAATTTATSVLQRFAELRRALRLAPECLMLSAGHSAARGPVAVSREFIGEDGYAVARIDGDRGATDVTLTVFFDEMALGPEPITVALLSADDTVLAWHRFARADIEEQGRLDIAATEVVRKGTRLVFAADIGTSEEASTAPFWPPWGLRDEYEQIARYVSPYALVGSGLASSDEDLRDGVDHRLDDERIAAATFELLSGRNINYALEPWLPPAQERQQVRDPRWVVTDRIGTCLDLALTYGSMALASNVAPLIALDGQHAFVLLRLGRLIQRRRPTVPPGARERSTGIYEVEDPDALLAAIDDGTLLAVECTAVSVEHRASFVDATAAGRRLVTRGLVLVDVEAVQADGFEPLAPPRRQPPIVTYVPRGTRPVRLFRSQERLIEALDELSGTAVIIAPQGQGKSTVARELAHRAPLGAAWFLDASEQQRLVESLADAELTQRNVTALTLPKLSRAEWAEGALGRLRDARDPWLVVLDNADRHPSALGRYVPEPRDDQLVLITTTEELWAEAPGVDHIFRLEPIDREDVVYELGHEQLLPLVDGRALLVDAYARYFEAGGCVDELLAHDPGGDDPTRGPMALYEAVVAAETGRREAVRKAAEVAALLPPDYVPVDLVARLSRDAVATAPLLRKGLLTSMEDGTVARMHRLIGAAVRAAEDALAPTAAALLADDDEGLSTIDRWADVDTTVRLSEIFEAEEDPDGPSRRALGLRLFSLATVLETKGHIDRSARLYERARHHLDDQRPDDQDRIAICRLGVARHLYQQHKSDEAKLRDALTLAKLAESSVAGLHGENAAGRFLAMQGLIEKALAEFAPTPQQQLVELDAALKTLNVADKRRRDPRIPADPSELLRSRFNLAGIRIDMAKRDPSQAARLLEEAGSIYHEVERERGVLYQRRVHPHIAACVHGRAIVAYYEAVLVERDDVSRTKKLRDATKAALEGLALREQLSGDPDSADVKKSTLLLAKISLMRQTLGRGAPLDQMQILAHLSQEVAARLDITPSSKAVLEKEIAAALRELDDAVAVSG